MRSRSRGAAEAAGTGEGSAIGAGARAAPIRLSNSGEVRISVKVVCTACWTAWAVASLTAAATDSVRASDRPSRIESNLSSWALNVLRVWPFVVGFMVILRVLLMTGEVARPDAPARRGKLDSDRLTVQGRPGDGPAPSPPLAHPPRNTAGSWRRDGESGQGSVGGEPTGKVAQAADQAGQGEGCPDRRHQGAGEWADSQVDNDCRGRNLQGGFYGQVGQVETGCSFRGGQTTPGVRAVPGAGCSSQNRSQSVRNSRRSCEILPADKPNFFARSSVRSSCSMSPMMPRSRSVRVWSQHAKSILNATASGGGVIELSRNRSSRASCACWPSGTE